MSYSTWFGLYIPDWSIATVGCTLLGLFLTCAPFIDPTPSPYSKFGGRAQPIPSQKAMVIIYFPSALAGILFFQQHNSLRPSIFDAVITFHFTKRLFEVFFVHVYKSSTNLSTVLLISGTYTISTTASLFTVRHVPAGVFTQPWLWIGLICVVVGELVNGYHHWLLRLLRSDKSAKHYSLPRGGLFNYCIVPHYAAEQLTYLGFIILSQNIVSLCLNLFPLVYLTLRAEQTYKWYAANLSATEVKQLQRRKRLLPGIW